MALANYTDLQAAIASWNFARTDLPTADLILLAETRLNRDLKLRNKTADASLTGVVDARTIALPSGFIEATDCWIVKDWGREALSQITPAVSSVTQSGEPQYWAIDGETLAFERPCDDDYAFVLRCITELSLVTTTTNWLMTNYPDTYLSACNVEAALWMNDDAQASRWEQRYQAAISGVNAVEGAASRAPLRTELADLNININPYNYQRGY